MHTYSYKEGQYNIINNKHSMLYLWYAINAPHGCGIVLTLYLYTTTNQHHLTSNSIFPILPFHIPTLPRSHLPIPYTTSHNTNIYLLFHTHTHIPIHSICYLPEPHIFTPIIFILTYSPHTPINFDFCI